VMAKWAALYQLQMAAITTATITTSDGRAEQNCTVRAMTCNMFGCIDSESDAERVHQFTREHLGHVIGCMSSAGAFKGWPGHRVMTAPP
jgi:hypothetical protein